MRLSLGGLPLSEFDSMFVRNPGEQGQHILFLLFSVEKNHKSLKVWGIFVYSLEGYLLSTQQGALGVWECPVSKAAVVSEVRRRGLRPLTSGSRLQHYLLPFRRLSE